MQGWLYSSDDRLSARELEELADALAMQLHNLLGQRVFWLQRVDVFELIEPYVCDLEEEDQQTLSWVVWHLFQDAREIVMLDTRR